MKTAAVIGVSSTIGFTISKALLEDGWFVHASHSGVHNERVEELCRSRPNSFSIHNGRYVSDDAEAIIHVRARLGPALEDCAHENLREFVNANVTEPMQTAADTVRLAKNTSQRVKLIFFGGGGVGGPHPSWALAPYAATKAAIAVLVESVAAYAKAYELPLDCNAIAPGYVESQMGIESARREFGIDVTDSKNSFNTKGRSKEFSHHNLARTVTLIRWLLTSESDGVSGKLLSAPRDAFKMNPETGVEVDDVFSPEKILESKGKELFTLRRVDGLEVHVKRLFEGVFEEHCDP